MHKSDVNFQTNPKPFKDEYEDFLEEEEGDKPNSNEDIEE